MSPRGHQRGAGGGGCTASLWRRPSGLSCAADMSGLITPAPVVRAVEARLRGPRVSFSWPAGQAEAARPLMGAQSEHPQEKQVLEGLSVALAVTHPLRARVPHPPPQLSPWFSGLSGSTVLLVMETMLLSRPTCLPNWSLLVGSPCFGAPCVVWLATPNLKGPGSPQGPSDPAKL